RRHPGGTEQHGYRCGVRGDVEERSPGTATAVTLRARLGQSHAVPTGLGLPTAPGLPTGPGLPTAPGLKTVPGLPRPEATHRKVDRRYVPGKWNGTSTDLARAERDVGQRARGWRPRCRDTRRQAPPGRDRKSVV